MRLRDFLHSDKSCRGKPELIVLKDIEVSLMSLGFLVLPEVPFLACNRCKGAFYPESFDYEIEKSYAQYLIKQKRPLYPGEVRFIRVVAGYSKRELAEMLGMTEELYTLYENPGRNRFSDMEQQAIRSVVGSRLEVHEEVVDSSLDGTEISQGARREAPKEVLERAAELVLIAKKRNFRLRLV